MHKFVLKPNETGELLVEMDTSRFSGSKIKMLLLTMKRGADTKEFSFTIAGISDHSP